MISEFPSVSSTPVAPKTLKVPLAFKLLCQRLSKQVQVNLPLPKSADMNLDEKAKLDTILPDTLGPKSEANTLMGVVKPLMVLPDIMKTKNLSLQ